MKQRFSFRPQGRGVVRPTRVRAVASLVCVCLLLQLPAPSADGAVPAKSDVDRAAQAVIDAQDRANRVAAQWAAVRQQYDDLVAQQPELQQQFDELSAKVATLQQGVEAYAKQQFVGGQSSISILGGLGAPTQRVEADALAALALNASANDVDLLNASRDDLANKQAALDRNVAAVASSQKKLEATQTRALSEVDRLKAVEEQTKQDAAVQAAVAAKKAEAATAAGRRAQLAADAEAAAAAATPRGAGTTDGPSGNGTSRSPSAGTADGPGGSGQTPITTASGGPAGGGNAITGCRSDCGFVDLSIVCPMGGPSAFSDTWGAARSGGRHHQGTDMIANFGTPLVAVVDGVAVPRHDPLGGTTIGLDGANGNHYYYAHMSSYAKTGAVQQGDVIGYVGHTGDSPVNHLHFEIHPNMGPAVNSYPSVKRVC